MLDEEVRPIPILLRVRGLPGVQAVDVAVVHAERRRDEDRVVDLEIGRSLGPCGVDVRARDALAVDRDLAGDVQERSNLRIDLRGVDNFQGSTSITGLGYMLYSGDHRRRHAAALMESWNVPVLRDERGKWRQRVQLTFIYEDLPQSANRVTTGSDPTRPVVQYRAPSDYTTRAIAALESELPRVVDALPVERFQIVQPDRPSRDFESPPSNTS